MQTQEAIRPRPLRVCYPFIGDNVGGSHISTLMLVGHLDRDKIEPVVVLHAPGPLADYVRQQGLIFDLLEVADFFKPPYWSFRNVAALLTQTWRIAAFLRKAQIDIVHANDVRIHFGWTLATRLAGVRLVWHQRTGSFGHSLVKLALARLSYRVVCISRYTATTLPKCLQPLVRVVANPFETAFSNVDREAQRKAVLAELNLPAETRVIGFFGNLVQQKRPDTFLRAAAEIDGQIEAPRAYLLFGAERNDAKARLTALARELGIAGNVHFMGFRAPVEPWMAACDLVIAPGVGEGLGRSLVEAMIVGTPVVAADSGGHRDVIAHGETGFLAKPDDPEAFATAAARVLHDPQLATKVSQRARAAAVQNYSIESHVETMTEIYRQACGGTGSVSTPSASSQAEPTNFTAQDRRKGQLNP